MAAQPQGAKSKTGRRSARNAELLEGILSRHEPKLRRQANVNSHLLGDADDALQEAYALFLEHYDGRWPALPYLLTTVKRCAWQMTRRASRRHEIGADQVLGPDAEGNDLWELLPHGAPQPAEAAERREALERRRAALAELKPDEQQALLLLGLGLSYAEIAELNSWTYTKVNRCIAEGRARLRELLAEEKGG